MSAGSVTGSKKGTRFSSLANRVKDKLGRITSKTDSSDPIPRTLLRGLLSDLAPEYYLRMALAAITVCLATYLSFMNLFCVRTMALFRMAFGI